MYKEVTYPKPIKFDLGAAMYKEVTRTQKRRNETKATIAALLTSKGWRKDRYNNYKKVRGDTHLYRYKFKDNVLRYECKVGNRWMRIRSGFWKNLKVTDEDKITGWR